MAAWQSRTGTATRVGVSAASSQKVAPNAVVVGWLLIALSSVLVIFFQPLWELGAPIWYLGEPTTAPSENIDVRRMWFSEGRRGRLAAAPARRTGSYFR